MQVDGLEILGRHQHLATAHHLRLQEGRLFDHVVTARCTGRHLDADHRGVLVRERLERPFIDPEMPVATPRRTVAEKLAIHRGPIEPGGRDAQHGVIGHLVQDDAEPDPTIEIVAAGIRPTGSGFFEGSGGSGGRQGEDADERERGTKHESGGVGTEF